ncbi:MAG: RHS repeat-associated core domain-containing protein, partial [Microcystaceae cyanobacterium]
MPETTFYVYDAGGERVRKVTERQNGMRKNERIYLGGFEIYREFKSDGKDVKLERETLHIMDDKQRIALVGTKTITNPDDESPTQIIRYQFSNHLGSASLELDDKANVISYEEYYPYGSTSYQAVDKNVKAAAKRYRYRGKERDEETGLYYHGARYYAPWLGRWIATDPTGIEDGLHLYLYVSNNPILRFDPDGRRGLIGEMREEQRKQQQQQQQQQKTVVLDSGKGDDFTKWATQFKQKDATKRDVVAYKAQKTIVENYQEAATKAGKGVTLVVSVGHGADAATAHCST